MKFWKCGEPSMQQRMKRVLCLAIALCAAAATALADYRTLRPGENSTEVMRMQQALAYLQYPLAADGKYGAMTEQTVKAFQTSRRLKADGLAGVNTLSLLFQLAPQFDYDTKASAPLSSGQEAAPVQQPLPAQSGSPIKGQYRMGDEANGVRLMQQRLMALNYPLAKADAVFGRGTRDAVILFQQLNGLKADGVAGQGTLDRLFSSSAVAYTAQATAAPQASAPPAATNPPAASAPPQQNNAITTARVVTGNRGSLNMRSTPQNAGSRNVVRTIPYGAEVPVMEKLGTWCRVTYQGMGGYVMTSFLAMADASAPIATAPPAATPAPQQDSVTHTAVVATQNKRSLNFRSAPNTNNSYLTDIPHGTVLSVYQYGSDWCRVAYNGRAGYVMTKYLTVTPVGQSATQPPAATTAPETRTLRLNMQGEDVLAVQKRLNALKYTVKENSTYDAATRDAVAKFQALNGLTADGVCGGQTHSMLLSSAAKPAGSTPTSYTTLKIDNSDSGGRTNIAMLQSRLKELGYPLKTNGTYDVATHQAVVGFQQRNGLTISGIANPAMQQVLYSAGAKGYDTPVSSLPSDAGKGQGVSSGSVKLLHWYKDIRPSVRGGQTVKVYHPASGIAFDIRFYSLGAHADSEPLTWKDTQLMNRAFGAPSWNVNVVYVQLPSGTWTLAAMHNRPHLNGGITDNGFGGHLCIHFLRDMDETQRNDPNYGVSNQKAIRNAWKNMTGETLSN